MTTPPALTPQARVLAQMLIDGIVKTVENANELFNDAVLLGKAGRVPRALLLHQISLEECGKADLLFTAVFEVLRGQEVDLKRLFRAFLKHQVKNNANAYFLPESEDENLARSQQDAAGALAAFKRMQEEFHASSNDAKNASLYVDFADAKFVAPSSVITKEQASDALSRNGQFMLMALDRAHLVLRWLSDLDAASAEVHKVWNEFGADKLDRDKPETIATFLQRIAGMVLSKKADVSQADAK